MEVFVLASDRVIGRLLCGWRAEESCWQRFHVCESIDLEEASVIDIENRRCDPISASDRVIRRMLTGWRPIKNLWCKLPLLSLSYGYEYMSPDEEELVKHLLAKL